MENNQKKSVRIFGTFFAIVLVFAGAFAPILPENRETAHALPGVPSFAFEVNPALLGGVALTAGASTVTAANATIQTTIMNILNGLAWSVAKMTIQSLTRSTVNWINSGFQGSPSFVSDLQANLQALGDAVADDFFKNLNATVVDSTGFNINSPFQDQIATALRKEYYQSTAAATGLSQYDLSGHSKDPKAFLSGDFSKGGFDAYLSASQNPANNPFGAYQLASKALWGQIDTAAKQRITDLGFGKGFLSWRGKCSSTSTTQSLSASTAEKCRNSPVRTPGAVIESQLENQLGSGVRQLELADSINEIVGALIGQLVNQVLGGGGLLGTSQPAAGGGSSYIDQATSNSQSASSTSSLADGVLQTMKSDTANITTYRDNWQKILDAAKATQTSCGTVDAVTSTVETSTTNVARGTSALTKLNTIQTEVQAAVSSTAADKATQITTAVTDYQTFLTSAINPTTTEIADSINQSIDTSSAPDTTQSTYSKMIALQKTCAQF